MGTWAVSPAITFMSAGATLNSSAAIWANMVAVPCPMAAAPVDTVMRPDRPIRTMLLKRPAPSALGAVGDADADTASLTQCRALAGRKGVLVDRVRHHGLALR